MIEDLFKQESWLKLEVDAHKTLFEAAKAKSHRYKDGFRYCLTLNPLGYIALKKRPELLKNSDFLIADGIGFLMLSKLFQKHFERIAGIGLAEALLEKGLNVALVGARASVSASLKHNFNDLFPNSTLVLCQDGFCFDSKKVIKKLKQKKPDLILVAMGSPKQEAFLYEAKQELKTGLGIGVGGAFDVWSGKLKRAPKFVQAMGLEWLFRMACEPYRFTRLPQLFGFFLSVLWAYILRPKVSS